MSKYALAHALHKRTETASLHDQMQIALAIAEENVLKSLLVDCTPPIAQPHHIGSISSTIGVPLSSQKNVDGLIEFESIRCILADAPVETDPRWAEPSQNYVERSLVGRRSHSLTRCESETHTLGQGLPLAQAIALLAHSGFSPQQVEDIINLPHEAWHKTWWYYLDAEGNFTIPFLRVIRTLRYTDGTITLQYKDYFSQDKPNCFSSQPRKVLVEIKPTLESFSKTLGKINYSREHCGLEKAILICNSLTELEMQGFISQGISLYTTSERFIPVQANCGNCVTHDCPIQGWEKSPVMMCRQFCSQSATGD
jgi:bacterioferritin-associated ferredoxin